MSRQPVGIADVPGPWVRDALCAQTDAEEFFPNAGEPHHRAVAHNEYGVWGGTSETQRRQIRAKRRNAA
jgi:hypothetical protein